MSYSCQCNPRLPFHLPGRNRRIGFIRFPVYSILRRTRRSAHTGPTCPQGHCRDCPPTNHPVAEAAYSRNMRKPRRVWACGRADWSKRDCASACRDPVPLYRLRRHRLRRLARQLFLPTATPLTSALTAPLPFPPSPPPAPPPLHPPTPGASLAVALRSHAASLVEYA